MSIRKLLVGLILAVLSCFSSFAQEKPDTLHVTVFVHGSVHSHLSLLSLQAVWKDSIEQDALYIKMLNRVRQNPLLWQSRFMLGMGPQEVSSEIIKRFHKRALNKEEAKLSAYHIVGSYDAFARSVDTQNKDRLYYLYGHLGMLSQSYRKNIGTALYFWLVDLVNAHQKNYSKIEVDIVAHSHGGNIALWLGACEDIYHRGLVINNLVMYATPIQVETFRFAYRPIFKRVYNLYSDGDRVQGLDRLSTERGKSYKTFSHPHLPISYAVSNVHDVRLLVNDKHKQVGHGNMFVMDCAYPATHALKSVPLVVFTPVFLSVAHQCKQQAIDCNLVDVHGRLYVEIKDNNSVLAESQNIYELSWKIDQLFTYTWTPDDTPRGQGHSRLGSITFSAIRDLWRDGDIKEEQMQHFMAKL